jgi:hypothetical protein
MAQKQSRHLQGRLGLVLLALLMGLAPGIGITGCSSKQEPKRVPPGIKGPVLGLAPKDSGPRPAAQRSQGFGVNSGNNRKR